MNFSLRNGHAQDPRLLAGKGVKLRQFIRNYCSDLLVLRARSSTVIQEFIELTEQSIVG